MNLFVKIGQLKDFHHVVTHIDNRKFSIHGLGFLVGGYNLPNPGQEMYQLFEISTIDSALTIFSISAPRAGAASVSANLTCGW